MVDDELLTVGVGDRDPLCVEMEAADVWVVQSADEVRRRPHVVACPKMTELRAAL